MANGSEFILAAIQASPVYLDLDASTKKACQLIAEAAEKGADLAAFSETWLPGYPFFYPYPINTPQWFQAQTNYLANAVEIPSQTTELLCKAAKKAKIDVVIGIVELDKKTRGTVYCTLLFIGREGKILGRHRKLKPTLAERMLWGEGDGVGLTVYERQYGRISGLSCGEHSMLLPAYALMAQGTQIHVAAWPYARHISDSSPVNGLLLSRAFAAQGNCFVIAVGSLLSSSDVPEEHRDIVKEKESTTMEGGSCIIAPGGSVIASASPDKEMILIASVSLKKVLELKAVIDVGAHYSRPDILQLHINRHPLERVVISE